jgi:hypothetical protein
MMSEAVRVMFSWGNLIWSSAHSIKIGRRVVPETPS